MRAGIDTVALKADMIRIEMLAKVQPGFISFKSYSADDGEVVSMSEWTSEAAVEAWALDPDYDRIVKRWRSDYYQSYTLFSCTEPRVRHFQRGHLWP